MSPQFALRLDPNQPGPAALRASAGEGGIHTLIPGAIGVNLLPGTAAPLAVSPQGDALAPIHRRDPEPDGAEALAWEVKSGTLQGKWRVAFGPGGLELSFEITTSAAFALITPLAVPVCADAGWLLLPGREMPFDLRDNREASQWVPSGDSPQAWALNSQGGYAVESIACDRPFDGVQVDRLGEHDWRVSLCHRDVPINAKITGKIALRVIPFNGAMTLETALAEIPPPQASPIGAGNPIAQTSELQDDGTMSLRLGNHTLRIAAIEEGKPLREKTVTDPSLVAREVTLGDRPAWEVTLSLTPVRPLRAVRLEAELDTPCGNPTWHGDATVMIPGNMARCNYHPDHPHGGGPKWGPGPVPTEREPLVNNDEAPGRCHGWTFAGSRLPQVWTAAADRNVKRSVWMGTTPRSSLGECCAGFVSPEGETTTLKLATPTTYEPWVPLGYSRMRPQARRDGGTFPEDEALTWTLWVASEETEDLNAWAPLDRGLYLRNRPSESTPVKMSLDEAAKICAGALHDHFYREDIGSLVYSTGPQGQHALVAFTGMAHSSLVMLWAGQEFGEERWQAAGTRVLDTVSRMFLQGPGFPWTMMSPGGESGEVEGFGAGSGEPGYVTMCGFDNLAEALRRERSWGRDHSDWAEALRRCADHWVKNQSPDGAYPHWGPDFGSNFQENEYEITNIEGGVMANMIDAFDLLGDDKYLESAKRAAAKYGKDIDDARLWGGPGDIQALVNSEVPMFLMRGFRRLFEQTNNEEHLRWLLAATAWRHSFQHAHSWPCDVGSAFWRQGWAGLGMESASSCNLHAVAFGSINMPDEWAVWKITGDDYHRQRCEDLARYSVQQFARFRDDLGFPFAGAGSESFWSSDTVWGKGNPWIFTDPGFDLGYMSWVTGWAGYGALWAREMFQGSGVRDQVSGTR